METINKRIAKIVENSKKTKPDFAKSINISQPFLSQICAGLKNPSDRTILDICREYHVREDWLRTGEEPMEQYISNQELLTNFFSDVLESAPDNRSSFIAALASLPPEFWGLVADFARELADNLKAQENDKKTE